MRVEGAVSGSQWTNVELLYTEQVAEERATEQMDCRIELNKQLLGRCLPPPLDPLRVIVHPSS